MKIPNAKKIHGKSNTRIYRVWMGMIHKGVICDEWRDFNVFYADIGEEFQKLDSENPAVYFKRVDLTKNYSKENYTISAKKQKRGAKHKDKSEKMYEDYIMEDVENGKMTLAEGKAEIQQNKTAKVSGAGGIFHGRIRS